MSGAPTAADLSVIVATYQQPAALELTLTGYAAQTTRGFEVVIADDGSGPETARVVDRARAGGLRVRHVRQEDRGFRKNEVLNRAVLAAAGTYLLFTDGDCVPRRDFVATHLRLASPDRFLSGGYLKLPAETSAAVDADAVRSGRAFDPSWLAQRGYNPGRRRLRLTESRTLARLSDALTPTRATWNGHGSSTWKEHIVAVNGFDIGLGYGGEDRVLGERLRNLGIRGRQIRHRAVCIHLAHPRPYVDPERLARNRRLRREVRRSGDARAPRGLLETEGSAP